MVPGTESEIFTVAFFCRGARFGHPSDSVLILGVSRNMARHVHAEWKVDRGVGVMLRQAGFGGLNP
jgi:hypothetical protein